MVDTTLKLQCTGPVSDFLVGVPALIGADLGVCQPFILPLSKQKSAKMVMNHQRLTEFPIEICVPVLIINA